MALRPQQSGPSNPGPEAAPQSMSDRHPPLPRGPPGRRVCLLHQPSPSLRPHPGLHQPCGHIARTAGCPGEPPVHSQLCLWEVGSGAGGHPRLLYRGQGGELVIVQGRLGCDEVFSLPSVLFQSVLPHRTLRHEAYAFTHSCPALYLPFNPYLFSTPWTGS